MCQISTWGEIKKNCLKNEFESKIKVNQRLKLLAKISGGNTVEVVLMFFLLCDFSDTQYINVSRNGAFGIHS